MLQARLGGVCTGRGLSCGVFWVITAEGELNPFCRRLNGRNDGTATDLEVQALINGSDSKLPLIRCSTEQFVCDWVILDAYSV